MTGSWGAGIVAALYAAGAVGLVLTGAPRWEVAMVSWCSGVWLLRLPRPLDARPACGRRRGRPHG